MDDIAAGPRIADCAPAHERFPGTSEAGARCAAVLGNLGVEIVPTNPLLPAGRKWAIRFSAGGTVTIVLGMRDYGRGWFSAYFAVLLAARLGIPFRLVRVYYSATLPAVLQTPQPFRIGLHGSRPGPIARAAADVIVEMCGRVIEKGRAAFAARAGVAAADIGFDHPTGRYYVLDRERSGSLLELAGTA